MVHFVDRHANKIFSILLLFAFVSFIYDKSYLSFILGLYFLVEVINERDTILRYYHQLSFKEYIFHVWSFFGLIIILTPITIYSLQLLDRLNSPTWVIYVYLFFLLNIAMYLYVSFLDKRKSK